MDIYLGTVFFSYWIKFSLNKYTDNIRHGNHNILNTEECRCPFLYYNLGTPSKAGRKGKFAHSQPTLVLKLNILHLLFICLQNLAVFNHMSKEVTI